MSRCKQLKDCQNAADFDRVIRAGGIDYQTRQNGSHKIYKFENGKSVPIPQHNGDIPNGTRHSILKALLAIGLSMVGLLCLLSNVLH